MNTIANKIANVEVKLAEVTANLKEASCTDNYDLIEILTDQENTLSLKLIGLKKEQAMLASFGY